jgi:diaminopimelate epimerase
MQTFDFIKMQGLGNDFVLMDSRSDPSKGKVLNKELIQHLANRRLGIGCDQFILIGPSSHKEAIAAFRIFNADGSEAEACGNGTRCVAAFLGEGAVIMQGPNRLLKAFVHSERQGAVKKVTVNMGTPRFQWQEIPLSRPANTQALEINLAQIHPKGASIYNGRKPVAVNMGNPHLVFFVDDINHIDLEILGPLLENNPLFPEKTNIGFVQVMQPELLLLKVWERGTGVTLACGTGACAALVAVYHSDIIKSDFPRHALVRQKGGDLSIEWTSQGDILMTGDACFSFKGTINLEEK